MNRMQEGRCPRCGFELLDLSKDFCSQCAKDINKEVAAKLADRKNPDRKRFRIRIGMLSGKKA